MAAVRFERATRCYAGAEHPALDSLDLTVDDGEFMVLVGPSGCGKTTSLRMVAGLEPVDSGRILIGDTDVTDADPKDRDIAMVFQNYALYPHMTVAQNMGFALKVAKIAKSEIGNRVREAARLWISKRCWTANPRIFPGASANGWRWGARSFAVPRCS